MEVAILIFDRLTALDAIGPYEVLRSVPGTKVKLVAKEPGPKRTDAGSLALVADYALGEVISPHSSCKGNRSNSHLGAEVSCLPSPRNNDQGL